MRISNTKTNLEKSSIEPDEYHPAKIIINAEKSCKYFWD